MFKGARISLYSRRNGLRETRKLARNGRETFSHLNLTKVAEVNQTFVSQKGEAGEACAVIPIPDRSIAGPALLGQQVVPLQPLRPLSAPNAFTFYLNTPTIGYRGSSDFIQCKIKVQPARRFSKLTYPRTPTSILLPSAGLSATPPVPRCGPSPWISQDENIS